MPQCMEGAMAPEVPAKQDPSKAPLTVGNMSKWRSCRITSRLILIHRQTFSHWWTLEGLMKKGESRVMGTTLQRCQLLAGGCQDLGDLIKWCIRQSKHTLAMKPGTSSTVQDATEAVPGWVGEDQDWSLEKQLGGC